jgi:hypothetical protein
MIGKFSCRTQKDSASVPQKNATPNEPTRTQSPFFKYERITKLREVEKDTNVRK